MIEFLKEYLSAGWHTKKEIIALLVAKGFRKKSLDRRFRKEVEKYDQGYYEGLHDSFVAHSNKGYILTSDPELIKKSINDDMSRLIALSKRIYGAKKRLKENDQLTLFPKKEMDVFEVLMKMGVQDA